MTDQSPEIDRIERRIVTVAVEYESASEYEALGYVYSRMVEVPDFCRSEREQTHDAEPDADPRHEIRSTFVVYTATAEEARARVLAGLGRWWEKGWDFGVAVDGEWLENCDPIYPPG